MRYTDPTGHYYARDIIPGLTSDSSWWSYQNPNQQYYKPPIIIPRESWGQYIPGSNPGELPDLNRVETEWSLGNQAGYMHWEDSLDNVYDSITLHHSGETTPPGGSFQEIIEEYHMINMYHDPKVGIAYYDVGYHYMIGYDGTIYEGRNINARGAHAPGGNDTIGIVLEGNFNVESPTEAQFDAAIDLVLYLDKKYGVGSVRPHNYYGGSECPGTHSVDLLTILDGVMD
jgi:hypothetical protein